MPVKPLLVLVFATLLAWPLLAGMAVASDACSELAPDSPVVRLSGLDGAGDPVLVDGRRLRLVGLAPRQDDAEAARFADGIGRWRERELKLVLLGEADRWGRLPARLYEAGATPGDAPRELAAALLSEGAALPLPEARPARCDGGARPARTSRQRARPQPPATPMAAAAGGPAIDGHDIAALKAQEGRLVLLEGRIASVGERAQRTYLNFSRRRGEAASIVLSKTLWREMQDGGWTATGVSGKRLRARGVLSGRDGLLLDVTSKLALELVD
ncbi:MAG TPA: hypothetical protein VGN82_05005 [Bosea sp. (in: a-proteobacteria)]|jgi:hypothetical protein|uniref:hypothetical protein n=1 Tax=Bosea sp. (in: a-proteobacteria) TaxID=1871050 RepID=UPI002E0DA423|nr:hypothetical protein [Bosea sp. (in: a-proteobacteria)]